MLLLSASGLPMCATADAAFTIDARSPAAEPETGYLEMGAEAAARAPDGRVLSVNSRFLAFDGEPWLPVMGEFHYSRFPEELWEDEILKMKAGGIQIVATYVIWIHHEEVKGQFDWTGRRNLRRFIELCGKHGMLFWLRIGPWAHAEVRNGGLPDWLLAEGPTRVSDPGYLARVRTLYEEIGRQAEGLFWKDGGPVIGVQIENEYTNRGPNGGAAHISTLKRMAIESGIDAPVFTVTGWDHTVFPPQEVIPVFGGYPDEPWAGSRGELKPDTQGVYQFAPVGGNSGILQDVPSPTDPVQFGRYPKFTAELGAGMQVTYHRRVAVSAEDITPIAITALGSGVTLLGYYMYHGGINPDGKLTTLQESFATDYPNDVPVKSYDFQAPLGEYGQPNASYRKLKVVHQFLRDFGGDLAPMTRTLPDIVPSGMDDTSTLRVSARTLGDRGFVFFNNYVRNHPLPLQRQVQVNLRLPSGSLALPRRPVDVPSQTSFFWPVNMSLVGAELHYATAQPFARLVAGGRTWFFFTPTPGIEPEFVFAENTVAAIEAPAGAIVREGGTAIVTGLRPSTDAAILLRSRSGADTGIVLLPREVAENAWVLPFAGRERMILTQAAAFAHGETIHLRSRDATAFQFSVFPVLERTPSASVPVETAGADGMFASYRAAVAPVQASVGLEPVHEAGLAKEVKLGPSVKWRGTAVAIVPDDSEFASAAAWRVKLPEALGQALRGVFLRIRYKGDIARLYAGDQLVDDSFYNGTPWEIGLSELGEALTGRELRIEVLPLRSDAPIYLPKGARPDFRGKSQIATIETIEAVPEYEVTLEPAGPGP